MAAKELRFPRKARAGLGYSNVHVCGSETFRNLHEVRSSLPSNLFARNQIWASGTLGLFISYVENKCQGKMPKSGVGRG